jgi:hypothetical protein
MIAAAIVFGIEHPFVCGLVIGGCLFGGAFGILGWLMGYEAAMRKVTSWVVRNPPKAGQPNCDVPTLPPHRSRRHIVTTPGRDL